MSENILSSNKTIAKNTLFLYFRMFIVMAVTLYATRVIIDVLGADDYGLYNAVGGVVSMLAFLNGTLSTGTARFITFELGRGDEHRLQTTFSTAFFIHLFLAIIIVVIMETGGLWFLYNKLNIEQSRFDAAFVTFQLSILTTFVSITQVPYTSAIMGHENMTIYAYVSIFEAVGKLLLVYLLSVSSYDKLVTYAFLMMLIQVLVALYYRYYCLKHYPESHIRWVIEPSVFKNMMGFSGWNVIANMSETLRQQGVLILLNIFFSPVVVAAQAIGNQIANQMMQFYNNFRSAINPKLIKLYSMGDYDGSRDFALRTNVYVHDLTLMVGLPLVLLMRPLLTLWLVDVPGYTIVFAQCIVIQRMIAALDGSFYVSMVASGNLKANSIAAIFFGIGQFLLLLFIFKFGGDVMWTQYIYIATVTISLLFIKPIILVKQLKYPIGDVYKCIWVCAKVTICSLVFSIPLYKLLGDSIIESIILLIWTLFVIALAAYIFLDREFRVNLHRFIAKKIRK